MVIVETKGLLHRRYGHSLKRSALKMNRSLLLLFVGLLIQNAAFSQTINRGLDLSFGNQGIVIDSYADGHFHSYSDVVLQPDGKIIGVGDYVARYKIDGHIDSSFADSGLVALNSFTDSLSVYGSSVALQSDGKILICGITSIWVVNHTEEGGFLLRLKPDGSLDSAFGNNGKVLFCCGYQHVLLQPDGNILVAGGSGASIILHRFKPDGSYDSSFGVNGYVETINHNKNSVANMGLLPDGRIALGGATTNGVIAVFAARYKPDGTLDSSLGGTGLIYPTRTIYISDFRPMADGKMVFEIGGFNTSSDAEVHRLKADGSYDSSFGVNGILPVPGLAIQALWIMSDGRILCGGYNDSDYVLCRLKPDGQGIDSSFGIHGFISTDVAHWYRERPNTIELQPDGRIILAGDSRADMNANPRASMVRYNADANVSVPASPLAERPVIRLYPNPAGNTLFIEAPSYSQGGVIKLCNIIGRLLLSKPFDGGRTTLNITDLPAGLYILHWQGAAQKFIKE